MWALFIFVVAVPGNNIPFVDANLTFPTVNACRDAASDVVQALHETNIFGSVRCVRLRKDLQPEPILK